MTEAEFAQQLSDWRAEREAQAAKTAHRRVPMPEVARGHCRWCGRPIMGRRGKNIGKPDPNRSWCRQVTEGRDCWHEFNLHGRAEVQYRHLATLRGERCASCGLAPMKWRNTGPTNYGLPPYPREGRPLEEWLEGMELHRRACMAEFPLWGKASGIERVVALEVDHVTPLWSVRADGLDLEAHRWFFGPGNLQLLCSAGQRCHQVKTAREAAERAALKRFRRAQPGLPLVRPRKAKGRGRQHSRA